MNNPSHTGIPSTLSGLARHGSSDQQQTAKKLLQAIGASNEVLVSAETVFPLTLFPTTITIDRTQVNITERDFFKAGEVSSIRIEDILNVAAQVGPILGSVKITTRFFNPDKPYVVEKLRRADALRIKRVLQGYLIARQKNIDCTNLPTKDLVDALDELGQVHPDERV